MARPKNEEKRLEIIRSAMKLFFIHGYNHTTYHSIAEDIHESRALIQYYFPKKSEFVVIFFKVLSDVVLEVLESRKRLIDEAYSDSYLIGQVYYSYIAENKEARHFIADILDDRSLSDRVLLLNTEWLYDYLAEVTEEDRSWSLENVLLRGGGLLTYIHYWIENNQDDQIKVEPIIRFNTTERMLRAGFSQQEIDAKLKNGIISSEEMKSIQLDLAQRMSEALIFGEVSLSK